MSLLKAGTPTMRRDFTRIKQKNLHLHFGRLFNTLFINYYL